MRAAYRLAGELQSALAAPAGSPGARATVPRRADSGTGGRAERTVDSSPSHFSLPPYRFDAATDTLWHGTRARRLRPRAGALLRFLLERPGQVVSADDVLAALWPGVQVGPGVVKVYVWEIRQALRDPQRRPRFLATVPGRGYRWIGEVATLPPGTSGGAAAHAPLVGRDAELGELRQRLARAEQGERQLVFVRGEPGIGKSALVLEFLRGAPGRAVASGQCIEQTGAGEAYLPVLSALGALARGPRRRQLVRALARHAPTWLVAAARCAGVGRGRRGAARGRGRDARAHAARARRGARAPHRAQHAGAGARGPAVERRVHPRPAVAARPAHAACAPAGDRHAAPGRGGARRPSPALAGARAGAARAVQRAGARLPRCGRRRRLPRSAARRARRRRRRGRRAGARDPPAHGGQPAVHGQRRGRPAGRRRRARSRRARARRPTPWRRS